LLIGRDLMRRLVSSDDWLPEAFAEPSETQGRSYLLYRDGLERFAVVSTVLWGGQAMLVRPGKVWEIFGVLRGSIARSNRAELAGAAAPANILGPGAVEAFKDQPGAVQLSNASETGVAIGVHVYGGEIGAISRFALHDDGALGQAVADYANPAEAPAFDIWSIQTAIED